LEDALSEVLLSVCLATFNRSQKLQRTLVALTEQISVLDQGKIEVVVGDNHSDDDTERVVSEYVSRHPFVRYLRHAENLGGEGNYKAIIERARGEFIWMLSDDDHLVDGCVRKILDVFASNRDVHYVFLNYVQWWEREQLVAGSSWCAAKADCRVTGIDNFFLETRFANSFISSNIYRRTTGAEVTEKWFYDTYWPQLYISCNVADKFPVYIVAEPVLMMGCLPVEESRAEKAAQGNDHFYMDAHLSYIRFVDYITARMVRPEAKRLARNYVLADNLYQIENYRSNVNRYRFAYIFSVFMQMCRFQPLRRSLSFWTIDVPVLLMPPIMFRNFWRYRKLRSKLPVRQLFRRLLRIAPPDHHSPVRK
jgi:glycosyltransferase involved in cell wall biosynthesis